MFPSKPLLTYNVCYNNSKQIYFLESRDILWPLSRFPKSSAIALPQTNDLQLGRHGSYGKFSPPHHPHLRLLPPPPETSALVRRCERIIEMRFQ